MSSLCSKQQKAKQELCNRRCELQKKGGLKVVYFYEHQQGWTTNAPYFDFELLPSSKPLFVVKKPGANNWYHCNQLCDYNDKSKAIGDLPHYVFFSPKCTEALMDMIGIFDSKFAKKNKNGLTKYYEKELKANVYQFESGAFRYSILTGNISVIEINNKFGDTIEYMIFPFASHQNHCNQLYGLAALNCQRNVNCQKGRNKNRNKKKNQIQNEKHNANSTEQKWRCDMICTKEGLIKFFQQWSDMDINKNNYFENEILPKLTNYQSPKNSCKFNNGLKIEGYNELLKDLKERIYSSDASGTYLKSQSKSHSKSKSKNKFDKMDYLREMMKDLGVNEYEFIPRMTNAINESISFARNHGESVLSQVYIDPKFARLYYEHVLYCQLYNHKENRYHKFGLAMMKMNKDNLYLIKGILTTKMVMDNIGLNKPSTRWTNEKDSKWWNSTMADESFSFYQYFNDQAMINYCPSSMSSISMSSTMSNSSNNDKSMILGNSIVGINNNDNKNDSNNNVGSRGVNRSRVNRGSMASKRLKTKNKKKMTVQDINVKDGFGSVVSMDVTRLNASERKRMAQEVDELNKLLLQNVDCAQKASSVLKDKTECVFQNFDEFGRTALSFCQKNEYGLLSVNKNININGATNIITVKENNIAFIKEERYDAFWNVLKEFCDLRQKTISSSLLCNVLGKDALNGKQKMCGNSVELYGNLFTLWFLEYTKTVQQQKSWEILKMASLVGDASHSDCDKKVVKSGKLDSMPTHVVSAMITN